MNILSNIYNINLKKNEIYKLISTNGSGKSFFFKVLRGDIKKKNIILKKKYSSSEKKKIVIKNIININFKIVLLDEWDLYLDKSSDVFFKNIIHMNSNNKIIILSYNFSYFNWIWVNTTLFM